MKLSRKYTTPLVGVMMTVFVLSALALPLPAKAETLESLQTKLQELLAQVAGLTGSQTAQMTAAPPVCRLTSVINSSTDSYDRSYQLKALARFLNRLGYTPHGPTDIVEPGTEIGTSFNIPLKNALYYYQRDAGLNVNRDSNFNYDPKLDSATLSHINSRLQTGDCVYPNVDTRPYYFYGSRSRGPSEFPNKNWGYIGDASVLAPGEKMTPKVHLIERSDNGSEATIAKGYRVFYSIHERIIGKLPPRDDFHSGSYFESRVETTEIPRQVAVREISRVAEISAPTKEGNYFLVVTGKCDGYNSKCALDYGIGQDTTSFAIPFRVGIPSISNIKINDYKTTWVNGTNKTIEWTSGNLPRKDLKFKVGLYTNLNGGSWGNSVFVDNATFSPDSTKKVTLKPMIGSAFYNKDYFIMIRAYNADGTEFRPMGKRVEAMGSQVFQVVATSTTTASIVTKEAQLASIYNTLENMLESLLK